MKVSAVQGIHQTLRHFTKILIVSALEVNLAKQIVRKRTASFRFGQEMGGGSIRNDVPFILVKAEDAGKVFRLE